MAHTAAVLRNAQWVLEPLQEGLDGLVSFFGGTPAVVDTWGAAVTLFQTADGVDLGLSPSAIMFDREKVKMDILRGPLVAFGPLDEHAQLRDADQDTVAALEALLFPVIPTVRVPMAS